MSVQNNCTDDFLQVAFLGTMDCAYAICDLLHGERVQQRPQLRIELGVGDHLRREHAVLAWVESSQHLHFVRREPCSPRFWRAPLPTSTDNGSNRCSGCRRCHVDQLLLVSNRCDGGGGGGGGSGSTVRVALF